MWEAPRPLGEVPPLGGKPVQQANQQSFSMASASMPASRSLPRFLLTIDGKLNEVSPFLTKLLFFFLSQCLSRLQEANQNTWKLEARTQVLRLTQQEFPYWTVSLAPSPLFYTYENLHLHIFFHNHKAYPSLTSFKKLVIINRFPVTIAFVYEAIRSMLTQLAFNHCWLLYCCCLWSRQNSLAVSKRPNVTGHTSQSDILWHCP